jgi:hypothetical protein
VNYPNANDIGIWKCNGPKALSLVQYRSIGHCLTGHHLFEHRRNFWCALLTIVWGDKRRRFPIRKGGTKMCIVIARESERNLLTIYLSSDSLTQVIFKIFTRMMILFLRSTMDEDEEEWTDEEDNEKLVLRINRLPLSELKDIISSINPSFSFTTKDG